MLQGMLMPAMMYAELEYLVVARVETDGDTSAR